MKKLKTILLYSFYILSLIYILFYLKNNNIKTKYNNENKIIGLVTHIKINDNYMVITLKGKEKIECFYYNIDKNIKIGDKVLLKGTLNKPKKNTNFNLFNYKNYLLSKKIY